MTSPRPKTLLTLFVLLILLAVVSATANFIPRIGFGNARPPVGQLPAGGFQGNNNGGAFQGNNQGITRPRNTTGNLSLFGIMRALGLGGAAFQYLSLAGAIIWSLILFLAAYGVWKQKRWGLNLALVLAILVLAGAVPGLFTLGGRFINYWRIAQNVFSAAAGLVILFLGILPSVRDSVS